jgi:glycosyltransferase involved in cell wall biosynthesis
VRSLLNDPVRAQRLGAAAAATARARFTWDRVAADFASVYGAQPRTASA